MQSEENNPPRRRDYSSFSSSSSSSSSPLVLVNKNLRSPWPLWLLFVSILVLVITAVFPKRLAIAIDDAVWEQTKLTSNKTKAFKASFISTPSLKINNDANSDRLILKFYMFDLVNAKDVTNMFDDGETNKVKPIVKEKGPYCYEVLLNHLNASWYLDDFLIKRDEEENEENNNDEAKASEIYYKLWQRVFAISTEEGCLDDSEIVTTVNVPFQLVLALAKELPSQILGDLLIRKYVGLFGKKKDFLFTTRSVHEHLFGYIDKRLMDSLLEIKETKATLQFKHQAIINKYPGFVTNISSMGEAENVLKFDAIRVNRAAKQQQYWFQGSTQLGVWNSREENRVGGSDGKFFHFFKQKNKFPVFFSEIVKKQRLVKKKKQQQQLKTKGIACTRLTLASEFGEEKEKGLLSLARVLLNVPVYASLPHFLYGDEKLFLDQIIGLSPPNESLHELYIDVHENTGLSVVVANRFQYNMKLSDQLMLPMFWFETIETMSEKHQALFIRCDSIVFWVGVLEQIGAALGVAGIVISVTVSILRQEEDSIQLQRTKMIQLEHTTLFTEPLLANGAHHHHQHPVLASPALPFWGKVHVIVNSPSIRRAWWSTPVIMFCMNCIVSFLQERNSYEVLLISNQPGNLSIVLQLVLTSFLIANFSSATASAVARMSFVRGELKAALFVASSETEFFSKRFLRYNHACGVGIPMGVICIFVFALPTAGVIWGTHCGAKIEACGMKTTRFILLKAFLAALQGFLVFPIAAVRALYDDDHLRDV